MLCCVGLIGGSVVGQALGGPWTFVAPAAGFGLGLVADIKVMKGLHRKAGGQQADADTDAKAPNQGVAAAQSGGGCGIATGLMRMFGAGGEKGKGEMTLAEIRRTYESGASDSLQQAQGPADPTVATAQPPDTGKARPA